MKKLKLILVLLITSFLLFGCNFDKQESDNALESMKLVGENLKPKEGGSISISVVKFDTLNPFLNKEKSVDEALKLVYDGLFTLDENYNAVPKLVKEYNFSSDKSILNIRLKDNILWHDGNSLTAKDVKFTIDLLKSMPDSSYYPLVSNINSVQALSSNNLEISFVKPYSFALENLVFPILPAHKLEGLGSDKISLDENNLVGNGMFKIQTYEKRKYIKLVKNENYYDKKPYINEIKMIIVPDKESQESMLISLETDICKINQLITGKYTPKRFNTEEYVGQNYNFLAMNFNNVFIQNIELRKALVQGIDRQKILREVYIKEGEVVEYPLSPNSKYYDNKLKNHAYSVGKAKSHLKKSGLKDVKLTLIVNQDNSLKLKTAYIIKDNLEDVGITVDVLELPWEELLAKLNKGEYDLALLEWKMPINSDPIFTLYSSTSGAKNFINYPDPNLEALTEKLRSGVNEDEKIKNYYELEKYTKENLPFISLLIQDEHLVLNNKIKGKLKSNNFNIYNGIEDIFIKYDE